MILLVVSAAIVLLLAAGAWQRSAAVAGAAILPTHPADSSPVGTDGLPGLEEMRTGTNAHSDALREALEATP